MAAHLPEDGQQTGLTNKKRGKQTGKHERKEKWVLGDGYERNTLYTCVECSNHKHKVSLKTQPNSITTSDSVSRTPTHKQQLTLGVSPPICSRVPFGCHNTPQTLPSACVRFHTKGRLCSLYVSLTQRRGSADLLHQPMHTHMHVCAQINSQTLVWLRGRALSVPRPWKLCTRTRRAEASAQK